MIATSTPIFHGCHAAGSRLKSASTPLATEIAIVST